MEDYGQPDTGESVQPDGIASRPRGDHDASLRKGPLSYGIGVNRTPEVKADSPLSNGVTDTVLSYNGSGVLRTFWTALRGAQPEAIQNAYFEVYTDGREEPSVLHERRNPSD